MNIVLADSSRVTLNILSRLLTEHGHECHCHKDGQDAYENLLSDDTVSIIATSFELPTLSGLELCWRARVLSNAGRPLYIMAMSSLADDRHLAMALDCGADDFITKPPRPLELMARLRAAERLLGARRQLMRLANCDPLTGVLNRRAFLDKFEMLLQRPGPRPPLTVALLDIDRFKSVNDSHGHDAGDMVLRAVAGMADDGVATVGRMGGEEFALAFEDHDLAEGHARTEALRRDLERSTITAGDVALKVTFSAGVTTARDGDSPAAMLKRADRALYAAKWSGRNRVLTDGDTTSAVQLIQASC